MKISLSKSYLTFGIILSAMALFVGFSLVRVFAAFKTADEIDSKLLESVAPRLTLDKLNDAIKKNEERKIVLLDEGK